LLHGYHFRRIVLDEATVIKDYRSQTSIACRALRGTHRWLLTGTPIVDKVEEVYPYFKFLAIKNTGKLNPICLELGCLLIDLVGTLKIFKKNFCGERDPHHPLRMSEMLRNVILRRTHRDRLFGAPVLKLPANSITTLSLELSQFERMVMEAIIDWYEVRFKDSGPDGETVSRPLILQYGIESRRARS
jgi:SNF2 family DNA or RNA helicase